MFQMRKLDFKLTIRFQEETRKSMKLYHSQVRPTAEPQNPPSKRQQVPNSGHNTERKIKA